MNDLFSNATELMTHAYYIAAALALVSLIPRMLFRAFNKKSPI